MHLILVEDEEDDCSQLACLIRENCAHHGESVRLSCFDNSAELFRQYQPGGCDAIFLDILLGESDGGEDDGEDDGAGFAFGAGLGAGLGPGPGFDPGSGLDAARKIRLLEPRLPIIFTTAEPDFALECYSVHPTDFLLKPLSPEKLGWCMNRLREITAAARPVIHLLETAAWGHVAPIDVPADQILYGQYSSHIIDVHTTLGVLCTRESFHDFVQKMPQDGSFCVCGRGLIVNLAHVKRIGSERIFLQNGEQLRYSRRRKREIDRAFTSWAFACVRKGDWL